MDCSENELSVKLADNTFSSSFNLLGADEFTEIEISPKGNTCYRNKVMKRVCIIRDTSKADESS